MIVIYAPVQYSLKVITFEVLMKLLYPANFSVGNGVHRLST